MSRRAVLKSLAFGAVAALLPGLFAGKSRAATVHKVDIVGFNFRPNRLTVAVGDRIIFKNKDSAPHSATAVDQSWDTDILNTFKSSEILVTSGMDESYYCKVHPQMRGKLVIQT